MPTAYVQYSLKGHHQDFGDVNTVVSYRSDGKNITGTLAGTDAVWMNLDLETGLVSHVKTRYGFQSDAGSLKVGSSAWEITPTYGAPVLGAYYNSGLNLLLNPIPPPSWLDSGNSEGLLGRRLELYRAGQQVSLGPDPYAKALGLESNETWVIDHQVFPLKHILKVAQNGKNVVDLEFDRLSDVSSWPANALRPNVTRPQITREPWKTNAYPPLGSGKLGNELRDLLAQITTENADVNLESDRVLVWDLAIWGDKSLPASNMGIVNLFTASLNIYVDGKDTVFDGHRTGLASGAELPWRIMRSNTQTTVQVEAGPWPDLIPLSDAYAAHHADWINHTASWRVTVYDQILKESPAFGAQLWSWNCDAHKAELRFYSLWNGDEILRQTEKC